MIVQRCHQPRNTFQHVLTIWSLTNRWGRERRTRRARSPPSTHRLAGRATCASPRGWEWTGCFCLKGHGRSRWSRNAIVKQESPSVSGPLHWGPISLRRLTRMLSTSEDALSPRAPQVCMAFKVIARPTCIIQHASIYLQLFPYVTTEAWVTENIV